MNSLGLIGGTSWHSTVEYYSYINQAVNNHFKNNTNPPLLVYTVNQEEVHRLQLQNDWVQIAQLFIEAGKRLKDAGAKKLILCANTPHKMYDVITKGIGLPFIHISDPTAQAITNQGISKVGIIGTIYTMEGSFIGDRMWEKHKVEVIAPERKEDRLKLHEIIQQELTYNKIVTSSKEYVKREIDKMQKSGAEGIILGCTEFPLMFKEGELDLPSFNTTYLHAMAAVDYILGKDGSN